MKFNLYCFDKNKTKDFIDLLKPKHGYTKKKESELKNIIGFSFQIFYKNPKLSSIPEYLDFINQGIKEPKITLNKKSVSLLVLIKVNKLNTFFAITFGSSHNILNKSNLIQDFGLKTVLNIVDSKNINLIDGKTLGGNTKERRTIYSKSTDFSLFGLDEMEELLTKLEGFSPDPKLGMKLSGKDSLTFNLSLKRFSFNMLGEQIEKYYGYYNKKTYRDNFSFIDNYQILKDENKIKELNNKLIIYINKKKNDYDDISISIPDMLENVDLYNVIINGLDGEYDFMNENEIIPKIKEILEKSKSKLNKIKRLKELKVFGTRFDNESSKENFSFYKCINFEFKDIDGIFVLNNGVWHIISDNFIKQINDGIDKIPFIEPDKSNIYPKGEMNFIKFDGKIHIEERKKKTGDKYFVKSEGVYNEFLVKHLGGVYLDAKNFTKTLQGQSKIEVCDVLLYKKMLHIKRGINSSTLSHLFNQALVSITMFKKHDEYIDFINENIKNQNKSFSVNRKDNLEIILGIIKNGNLKKSIPFFSKITLLNLNDKLKIMGSELKIVQILDNTNNK